MPRGETSYGRQPHPSPIQVATSQGEADFPFIYLTKSPLSEAGTQLPLAGPSTLFRADKM